MKIRLEHDVKESWKMAAKSTQRSLKDMKDVMYLCETLYLN